MKKLILLLIVVPMFCLGQTQDELKLCMAIQTNQFSSNSIADSSLEKILNVIGAKKNFVLSPCSNISKEPLFMLPTVPASPRCISCILTLS